MIDKVLYSLDILISLQAVTLFGFAYPSRFRVALWENGGVEGWNSIPNLRIYYYANHREPPEIPLLWTQEYCSSSLEGSIA